MFVYIPPVDGMRNGSFIVHGKLTVEIHNPTRPSEIIATIVKTSSGEKEEMKGMTAGSHIKSAESDAFKKAASRLGVALDLYWQDADEDYLDEQVDKLEARVAQMREGGMEDEQIAASFSVEGMGRSAIARALGVSIRDVNRWCRNGA